MKLSVIIPVYNEQRTIKQVLNAVNQSVLTNNIEAEIIVVDDGSLDNTVNIIKDLKSKLSIQLITGEKNRGKGSAVRKGILAAKGDVILIQDADLEYDPKEYPALLEPIKEGKADVVYGSRFMNGPRRLLFYWHSVGNHLLTTLSNMVTNLNFTDIETGFKVFKSAIIKNIHLESDGFEFEIEVSVKIAKLKCRIYEVPVSYYARTYDEGKKITWKDGIKAILTLIKYHLKDDEGDGNMPFSTLIRINRLDKYNDWLFGKIKKYIGNTVLEAGSGIGNITKYLLDSSSLICTDIDEKNMLFLKNRYERFENLQIERFDLEEDPQKFMGRGIDTLICMNVLEHIQDDQKVLESFNRILEKDGNLILLVPATKILFGSLDKNLKHYRRYDRAGLLQQLDSAGFKVSSAQYLNGLGAVGWFINSRIFKRKTMPSFQTRAFDLLVPILWLEKFVTLRFGLSLLVIASKGNKE